MWGANMFFKRRPVKKKYNPSWLSTISEYVLLLRAGDYSRIPSIFCVFAYDHLASKTNAARALAHALINMTFDDLIHIDTRMRQATSMEWSIGWHEYSISDFFTPYMSEDERRAVIIFASFNPNGFIRERAVHMMKDYDNTLSFAILRLNDWVSQVRSVAACVVDYRLSSLTVGELTNALPYADKVSRGNRVVDSGMHIKCIYAAITSPENKNELISGFASKNIRTRRICTNALLDAQIPRYDLALKRLTSESDPFLRARIFRRLMEEGQVMDDVVILILKDAYPICRLLAFMYICNNNQDTALQVAHDLLLDKSAKVREHARSYLKEKNIDIDYRIFYKSHLTDYTVSAIHGLGETGTDKDTSVVEKYLKANEAPIARAAMTAVMKLNGNVYISEITEFLTDSRVGIVKTARNLIIKTTSINYSRVVAIFHATPYENTKQKCFSIMLTDSKWQRLIYILDVLENGGEKISETALLALHKWIWNYNRSFAVPSDVQSRRILEGIHRLENKLSTKMQQQLLFLFR